MAGIGTTLLNGYIVLRQCRPSDEGAHPKLSTEASNATINRELAALKRMFYHGMEQDPPKVLRVPTIKMLPEPEARQGVVANNQYQDLIRELPSYLRAFIATLYFTGMRFREALWLRWTEIDWLKRTIHLPRRRTKNKSPKVVKFDDELYQWLNMQRQIRDAKFPECEWVFFGKTGKQIRNPYGAFRTACRRAGIFVKDHELTRPPTFHDFRRTFATEMRRAGVAEGVIMDMAGWKTRSIFERYFIKDESDQQEALRKRKEAAISTSLNKDERSQAVPQKSVVVESTN